MHRFGSHCPWASHEASHPFEALRHVLVVALAAGFLASVGCGESETAPVSDAEPTAVASDALNVLIITLDTTSADALGVYGQERDTTPSIDRFSAGGVIFDQAATAQPSTLPSHATIMTGKLPFTHGARANAGYVLSEDNETLAEIFQGKGYVTGAEIAAPVIGRRTLLDQGFATYRDLDSYDSRRKLVNIFNGGENREVELVERDGADITRRGLEFLRRNQKEPFFLWLHYFDPHVFYAAPPPFDKRFKDAPYYAEVHYTDFNVGRILTELRRLGIDDKTLVVITADHGESLGEHDEISHSYFVYESTMHVPLIFVAPGVFEGGRRVSAPVRTVDIAPTILDLAGFSPMKGVEGISLVGLIRGEGRDPGFDLYGESFEPLSMFGTNVLRFLRRGNWKYIHKLRPELFDLATDPNELNNVLDQHPGRATTMRQNLVSWVEEKKVARDGNRVQLDEAEIAQLNALGYVGEGAPMGFDEADDLANLQAPDPVDRIDDALTYATAWGAIKSGMWDKAYEKLAPLLERNPESLPILRAVIAATHDEDPAIEARAKLPLLDLLIELEPMNPHHLISRSGLITALGGDPSEAEEALRGALVVEECNVAARIVLANFLNEHARYADQHDLLRDGVAACDREINTRNDLAYLLATAPDGAIRDGPRALALAKELVRDAEVERPDFLDTLACAFAEAGNFKRAKIESRRAITLLRSRKAPDENMTEYLDHLARFESAEAVRVGGSAVR